METSVETMDPLGVNAPMQPEGEPSSEHSLQITGPAANTPHFNANSPHQGIDIHLIVNAITCFTRKVNVLSVTLLFESFEG